MDKSNSTEVQSVVRAFKLLNIISKENLIGLSDLARKSELKKPTVARLLNTLKSIGIVDQDQHNHKFSLALQIVNLSSNVLANLDLKTISHRLINEFVDRHKVSILLSQVYRDQIYYVDKMVAPGPYQITVKIGYSVLAHCTSTGKAILAYLPSEKRHKIIGEEPYQRCTPQTITDADTLEKNLALVRQRGFALDLRERYEELMAVAVPIFQHDNEVIGAVTIPNVATSTNEEKLMELSNPLINLGREISFKLGWKG